MSAPRFAGRVALVTGAASGLGEAIARRLSAEGARVAILDRDEAAAVHLADELEYARAFTVDVADEAAVDAAFDAVIGWAGRIDLAVNNAGINQPSAPVADMPTADWRRTLDVNLTGVFLCLRREIALMRAQGGGAIVNMASALGAIGIANAAAYVAAKHGVIGLTKSAAIECAGAGIRVNAVAPGLIATPLVERALTPERRDAMAALHPLARLADAGETAGLVLFLLSDEASFITGSTHFADGGWTAW